MDNTLDKFRFKTWVKPEHYVHYLTKKLYQAEANRQNDSWFWKEPGHLYCFIFLSLFGHHVKPKYRCLIEAYQRCDLGGLMVAQRDLSTSLKMTESVKKITFRNQLLVALILCGVDRAGAQNRSKVTARGALRDVILGELSASAGDRGLLTENHIKAALTIANEEKSQCNANVPGNPGVCSGMSPEAAAMFPDTFNMADKKAITKTKSGGMESLKEPMDPHSEWQRIAAGPHPLSIFETSWILVHFRLQNVHAAGLL